MWEKNTRHLIATLRNHYELEEDWDSQLYCGISLKWDYHNRHVDISMPAYIDKMLTPFNTTLQRNHSIAHILPQPESLGQLLKTRLHTMTSNPSHLTKFNAFNK